MIPLSKGARNKAPLASEKKNLSNGNVYPDPKRHYMPQFITSFQLVLYPWSGRLPPIRIRWLVLGWFTVTYPNISFVATFLCISSSSPPRSRVSHLFSRMRFDSCDNDPFVDLHSHCRFRSPPIRQPKALLPSNDAIDTHLQMIRK
jgi:hypothetical protein